MDPDRPCRRLGEICDSLGVAYLNLTPVFRDYHDHVELFLKENAHWNAKGHLLAARAAAEKILALETQTR